MASKLGNITFDCADPTALATFWADVFGYPHPEWPEDMKAELLANGLTEEDLTNKSAIEDPDGVGRSAQPRWSTTTTTGVRFVSTTL